MLTCKVKLYINILVITYQKKNTSDNALSTHINVNELVNYFYQYVLIQSTYATLKKNTNINILNLFTDVN